MIDFLSERKQYFWDCDIKKISKEAVMERLINYAELDDIKLFVQFF